MSAKIDEFQEVDVVTGAQAIADEKHRQKWEKFVRNTDKKLKEDWLWQYWKSENRTQSQVSKILLRGFDSRIRAQKKVKKLIRSGIPAVFRPQIWWVCSGGADKMEKASADQQYAALPKEPSECTPAAPDIEKDLHRTFPNNDNVSSEDGLTVLRRVLLAYSVRNPGIGYCQSMNFITALLLMYLDEEQAFWVLAALIEDILPADYYAPSLIGSRVEQQVLQSCLAWKLPAMHKHFKNAGMILEPVTCSWLLCTYINTMPLTVVLRIWDCLFWEGNIVLLRIGLSVCKIQEARLMRANDFVSIYKILKDPFVNQDDDDDDEGADERGKADVDRLSLRNADHVLATAFDKKWIGSLPRAKIDALRKAFKTVLETNSKNKRAAEAKAGSASQPPKNLSPSVPSAAGDSTSSDVLSADEEASRSVSRVSKRATLQTSLDIETTLLSKVTGTHACRRSSALARPSIRRSMIPNSRPTFDQTGDSAAGVAESTAAMTGLIVDDGEGYAAHNEDDDEAAPEQTIDEYIALLQQQRLDDLGGDGDNVADDLLNQILGDGSLNDDDDDDEKDTKKESSGSFGGLMGSVFGRKASSTFEEDDDDDDDDVVSPSDTQDGDDVLRAVPIRSSAAQKRQSTAMVCLLENN